MPQHESTRVNHPVHHPFLHECFFSLGIIFLTPPFPARNPEPLRLRKVPQLGDVVEDILQLIVGEFGLEAGDQGTGFVRGVAAEGS